MATLKSIATGNWTSASTWGLCNATAELDSEAASTASTTSYVKSSSFTPGAITISGICVKLAARAGTPTGTFSVELYNATGAAVVAGTTVTIDVADIPFCDATDQQGGWLCMKFASNVTLSAATAYQVEIRSSNASSVTLYRDATAGNWSRQLVTTTTQAPVAGDKLIINGDKTGQGTSISYTVTMNETTTTDYGTGSTTIPSINIGSDGTLSYGTSGSTNYNLRCSGVIAVYGGGALNIGTSGSEIPRTSTAKIELDCASGGDFGLDVRGGTFNSYGLSRTSGKNISQMFLDADAAVSATSLTVSADSGWLSGDEIALAPTQRVSTQYETATLASNAGASSLSISSGLTYAHDGNADYKGEIILLTRNVNIVATNASFRGYIRIRKTATANMSWTSCRYIGVATGNKEGVRLETTTGSVSLSHCISRDSANDGFRLTGTASMAMDSCSSYLASGIGFNQTTSNNVQSNVTANNIFSIAAATGVSINSSVSLWSNVYASGCSTGISLVDGNNQVSATVQSNWYSRSNSGTGLAGGSSTSYTISNLVCRRNAQYGMSAASTGGYYINGFILSGNTTNGIFGNVTNANSTFKDGIIAGETGYAQANGISPNTNVVATLFFENCKFGDATGIYTTHTTTDIAATNNALHNFYMRNCVLGSETELTNQSTLMLNSFIISEGHDQVNGALKIFKRYGSITRDTSIFTPTSPSYRLTPTSASFKLSHEIMKVACASGAAATVKVKVRESVVGDGTAYNGSRIRLIVRANSLAGISSDTVLATATIASVGAFEELTGTTSVLSGNAVLEFIVDCDGTEGWINVDDITAPAAQNTLGLGFGDETLLLPSYGNNSSGGGSSGKVGYAFMT